MRTDSEIPLKAGGNLGEIVPVAFSRIVHVQADSLISATFDRSYKKGGAIIIARLCLGKFDRFYRSI
jgi:hypothetical protein